MPDQSNSIFLYPAALIAPTTPSIVHTILGSCVAVCLFDPKSNLGGINHYMLPLWNGQGLASPKFGNIAIEKLHQKMLNNGANKATIIAKVFGGGEVLNTKKPQFHVGKRNINVAFEVLEQFKIPVIAQSVGGKNGRKLIYNTGTGEVSQRYVISTNNS